MHDPSPEQTTSINAINTPPTEFIPPSATSLACDYLSNMRLLTKHTATLSAWLKAALSYKVAPILESFRNHHKQILMYVKHLSQRK